MFARLSVLINAEQILSRFRILRAFIACAARLISLTAGISAGTAAFARLTVLINTEQILNGFRILRASVACAAGFISLTAGLAALCAAALTESIFSHFAVLDRTCILVAGRQLGDGTAGIPVDPLCTFCKILCILFRQASGLLRFHSSLAGCGNITEFGIFSNCHPLLHLLLLSFLLILSFLIYRVGLFPQTGILCGILGIFLLLGAAHTAERSRQAAARCMRTCTAARFMRICTAARCMRTCAAAVLIGVIAALTAGSAVRAILVLLILLTRLLMTQTLRHLTALLILLFLSAS